MTINSEQFREICNGVWCESCHVAQGSRLSEWRSCLYAGGLMAGLSKAGIRPILSAENYGSASSCELGVSLMVLSILTSLCKARRTN